jgi:hypothetical protein
MKEVFIDMELLSFLVEFGTVEFITTTKEPFSTGELLKVRERDSCMPIAGQITNCHYLKKRKSGLLCYQLTVSYIVK